METTNHPRDSPRLEYLWSRAAVLQKRMFHTAVALSRSIDFSLISGISTPIIDAKARGHKSRNSDGMVKTSFLQYACGTHSLQYFAAISGITLHGFGICIFRHFCVRLTSKYSLTFTLQTEHDDEVYRMMCTYFREFPEERKNTTKRQFVEFSYVVSRSGQAEKRLRAMVRAPLAPV